MPVFKSGSSSKAGSIWLKKDIQSLVPSYSPGDGQFGQSELELKRTLSLRQLIFLGIGGIIGAGIFTLTGEAAAHYAGPAVVFSFIAGGVLSLFCGLCYAEMAGMVPLAGSAYSYAYYTLGELSAWIIGWDLLLEYGFGAVAVALSWSAYLVSFLQKTLEIPFSPWVLSLTRSPWEQFATGTTEQVSGGIWNVPASCIVLVLSWILSKGIESSSRINNGIVFLKVTIILVFIFLGLTVVAPENWIANPAALGLSRLVPLPEFLGSPQSGRMIFGWHGVLAASALVFFAYIGFDALSTTAQECLKPRNDLPIAILISIFVCTLLYVFVALVITGVVPYRELAVPDPMAVGVDRIALLHAWPLSLQKFLSGSVKIGALAGLTSVILVFLLSQSRILFALSQDGLLPLFREIHPTYRTPFLASWTSGVFVSISAGLMPLSLVGELVSIGTLWAFLAVCLAVLVLRIKSPELARSFRVPLLGLVAPLGILSCLLVMSGLPWQTWVRLLLWLFLGLTVYFSYGKRRSLLQQAAYKNK